MMIGGGVGWQPIPLGPAKASILVKKVRVERGGIFNHGGAETQRKPNTFLTADIADNTDEEGTTGRKV